jgi:hypothetical protein
VWYFKLMTISISSKEVENFAVMCDHPSLFKMYSLVISFSIFFIDLEDKQMFLISSLKTFYANVDQVLLSRIWCYMTAGHFVLIKVYIGSSSQVRSLIVQEGVALYLGSCSCCLYSFF